MIDLDQFAGSFPDSYSDFKEKRKGVKGLVLDWDGVFNDGVKNENSQSHFSEVDAMGINMFRFSHYLATGELIPIAILTGEENGAVERYANREHLNTVIFKSKSKTPAAQRFCKDHGLDLGELAWVYDDVLDFDLASHALLRMKVSRAEAPLTNDFVIQKKLVDYSTPAKYAVRECMELMMLHNNNYMETFEKRSSYSSEYQSYLEKRNLLATQYLIFENNDIIDYQP